VNSCLACTIKSARKDTSAIKTDIAIILQRPFRQPRVASAIRLFPTALEIAPLSESLIPALPIDAWALNALRAKIVPPAFNAEKVNATILLNWLLLLWQLPVLPP
jgi:hypothetical protein